MAAARKRKAAKKRAARKTRARKQAPKAPPTEAEAQAAMRKARADRVAACQAVITAALEEHGCRLVVEMHLRDGLPPRSSIGIEAV